MMEVKPGDKVQATWTLGDGLQTVVDGEIDRQDEHGVWVKTDRGLNIRFRPEDLRAA